MSKSSEKCQSRCLQIERDIFKISCFAWHLKSWNQRCVKNKQKKVIDDFSVIQTKNYLNKPPGVCSFFCFVFFCMCFGLTDTYTYNFSEILQHDTKEEFYCILNVSPTLATKTLNTDICIWLGTVCVVRWSFKFQRHLVSKTSIQTRHQK